MLKIIYIFFLGLILATFVGVGIAAFYPSPKAPEAPTFIQYPKNQSLTEEEQRQQAAYDQLQKAFIQDISKYNRIVSMTSLDLAVLFLVIGLWFAARIDILADGLVLGGVFTLLYSIGRGFATEDTIYRFLVVSAGLLVALVIGYIKFIRPGKPATRIS